MPQNESESESRAISRPISIIMDDREPRDVMMQALSSCGCFIVEVQHLPVGDYLIDDALLIERKTLPDLARSILDGRLFQQALHLVEAKYPAALILEGGARAACAQRFAGFVFDYRDHARIAREPTRFVHIGSAEE